MDVVIIFNGLGNQMSQYAFYLSKLRYNPKCRVMFDPFSTNEHNGSELDRLFGVTYKKDLLSRLLRKVYTYKKRPKIWSILKKFGFRIIKEPVNYDYSDSFLKKGCLGINFYVGGWHSEKYFENIRNEVCRQFSFPKIDANSECASWIKEIKSNENSVSIHVRRGDFLKIEKNNPYQLGGVATDYYYQSAVEKILQKVENPVFYCFSNDIEWCKRFFNGINVKFVTCNSGKESWRDLFLMSLCRHHINANSTFSWWGAWLSYMDGITICPNKFLLNTETKDIYPESWVKMPTE